MNRDGITRRRALALLGGAVLLSACGRSDDDEAADEAADPTTTTPAAAATGAVTPDMFGAAASCAVTPEQTEGPFYIDVDKLRSDVREDRPGVPLRVAARVLHADGCTPLKDALFEIWHCDANGAYSSGSATFLRGGRPTNADGIAVITTVYPGWYQGRAVHVHAKVHLSNREALTTQFYFDEAVTTEVYKQAPYDRRGAPSTTNARDSIYRRETMLTLKKDGDGYLGLITLGVQA